MADDSTTQNPQIQTIVVHVDQLVPENMIQLAQAGYRVIRDSSLLIFGRNLEPSQQTEQELQQQEISAALEGEVLQAPVAPTPIKSRNNNNKR